MTTRSRGWCMTLNNYSESDYKMIYNWMMKNCDYGVIGKEVGESGTPHLQICCEFKTMKSFKQMKEVTDKWHIEKRIGSKLQSANYCKKDGDFVEIGTIETEQGKRNDLNTIREAVKEGKNMREICDLASNFQAIRFAETLRKYTMESRSWKTKINWYYGPTGTGKTRLAMEESDPNDRWVSLNTLRWWDGYDGHKDVIIDDFRPDDCSLKTLLRIFDRYEYRVENKGGSTQLLAKNMWITCPFSPAECYKNSCSEDMQQLLRRIENIICFDADTYENMSTMSANTPRTGYIDCDDEAYELS